MDFDYQRVIERYNHVHPHCVHRQALQCPLSSLFNYRRGMGGGGDLKFTNVIKLVSNIKGTLLRDTGLDCNFQTKTWNIISANYFLFLQLALQFDYFSQKSLETLSDESL